MTGRKLGNYEILDKLGVGGMGEVWRARDSRLNRSVAVKVLPSDMAGDPQRRQRFEQEARALGALNHPNIVAIYDIGQSDGHAYIVSELVEGESLRKVVERGPVSGRKLIEIASQSAEAIAAAHSLSIIHRDLKPENIMLTREGRVKVLDFGLAKQNVVSSGEEAPTVFLSQPGMVLGTVGYMSPEQVRGEAVDARGDIFSLGCVLYELATGKRTFEGKSSADVMSAILNTDPPPLAAPVPPALDAIIRRCLEKDASQRFQSAADLAFALRSISNVSNLSSAQPAVAAPRRNWIKPAATAIAAVVLVLAGYFLHARLNQTVLPTFHRITFREGHVLAARFAPDGRSLLYAADWDGGPDRVYWAAPGNPESLDLGLGDARLLSVSSKGDLAFLVGPFFPDGSGTLARNSVSGGQTRELLEHVLLADWSPDGSELAVVRVVNGKNRLEFPVGTVLWETIYGPFSIRVSPDGQLVAYTTYDNGTSMALWAADRKGSRKKLGVISGQTSSIESAALCWTRDGREIWFRSFDSSDWNTIHAMSLSGTQRVVARFPSRIALFDLAPDGRLLLSTDTGRMGIRALAPNAKEERDLSVLESSDLKGISDDGRVLLANVIGESGGAKGSIYLRTDGSPPVRLGDGVAFALSPDGKWVTGYSSRDAATRKFMLMPTGPGEVVEFQVPGLRDNRGVILGWLPGEENYLVGGWLPDKKGWRFFDWNARSKSLQALTPEVPDEFPLVSPDRRQFLTTCGQRHWCVFSTDGSGQRQIAGLTPHDTPVGWRADSRAMYVMTHHDQNNMVPISIVELEGGKRTPWKELHAPMAVDAVSNPHITPDGRGYAYNYSYVRSQLLVGEGLK